MMIVMDVAGVGKFSVSWYNLGLERFLARSRLITKGMASASREKVSLYSDSGFLVGMRRMQRISLCVRLWSL
jgi:hypothetical protein